MINIVQYFIENDFPKDIIKKIEKESSEIGYYNLPEVDVTHIEEFAKKATKKNIVVVGIGGSSLGTSAVYDFLKHSRSFDKNIFFLESTDPVLINSTLKPLDFKDTVFLIISKSGSTIETISIFKYLLSKIELSKEHFIIISDENSPLHKLSIKHDLEYFSIPTNVGGRFSVLSNVGLVPLAMLGVDIRKLLNGAKRIKDDFFACGNFYKQLVEKSSFYARNLGTYNINCIFSYSEVFRGFNSWYIQLWGESLGKKQLHSHLNIGLTPIGLIGPTDQHSFLQLIVEGKRNKSVTFIKIKDFNSDLKVPDISIPFIEKLDFVNGTDFSKLINLQADSIIKSLSNIGDIPLDIIEIDSVDEESIGMLFYYYELLTSLVAIMIDVNAYDQPGVEDGKKILRGFFD